MIHVINQWYVYKWKVVLLSLDLAACILYVSIWQIKSKIDDKIDKFDGCLEGRKTVTNNVICS